jgi:hypothetical protein
MAKKKADDIPAHPGWKWGLSPDGFDQYTSGAERERRLTLTATRGSAFDILVTGRQCRDARAAAFPFESAFTADRPFALDVLRRGPEAAFKEASCVFEAVEKGFSLDPTTGAPAGGPVDPDATFTINERWGGDGSSGMPNVFFAGFPVGHVLYLDFDPRAVGVRLRVSGPHMSATCELSNDEGVSSLFSDPFFTLPHGFLPLIKGEIREGCMECPCENCKKILEALDFMETIASGKPPSLAPVKRPAAYRPDGPETIPFPGKGGGRKKPKG